MTAKRGRPRKPASLDEMPEAMTPEQVAAVLNVGLRKVYWLLQTGQLPGLHLGRTWRIGREALRRHLHQGATAQATVNVMTPYEAGVRISELRG